MKQKLLLILGLLVIFTAVPVKSEDDVEALDSTTPLPVEEVKIFVKQVMKMLSIQVVMIFLMCLHLSKLNVLKRIIGQKEELVLKVI